MWYKFFVWERGGPEGDDKFDIGHAYGRMFVSGVGGRTTFVVERLICDESRQHTGVGLINNMPALPISADWNRENQTLCCRNGDLEQFNTRHILRPDGDDVERKMLCQRADILGILVLPSLRRDGTFNLYFGNNGCDVLVPRLPADAVYAHIAHMPVEVDITAWNVRQAAVGRQQPIDKAITDWDGNQLKYTFG